MKQLARTAVYWLKIDTDIQDLCAKCSTCAEHRPLPSKAPVQSWTVPDKPWSRLHIDHAVNFLGQNWLVVIDAFSKYPCIHATASLTALSTINLLEEDFAHFGYPHAIVSDNAPTFKSEEFQTFCGERGITHVTGAPYHPATNGAAERLVRTFKQALRKSSLPPRQALQQFLQQYRRTPNPSGYSPSQLLNNRQIRTRIDTLLPVPAQIAVKQQPRPPLTDTSKRTKTFHAGDACYAQYFGPKRTEDPRWVSAEITRCLGTRRFLVHLLPHGPTVTRHLDQLRSRHASPEDTDPGDVPSTQTTSNNTDDASSSHQSTATPPNIRDVSFDREVLPEYGRHQPRRSTRIRRPPDRFHY